MASTNKTNYYDLSQFTANDKLSVMGDYNNDMRNIDAGLYEAQTTANVADGKADTAQTTADIAEGKADTAQTDADRANGNIGTMANLNTTEKNTIVGAINEVNGKANNNTSDIANLINKLNLNVGTDIVYAPAYNNVSFVDCTHAQGGLKVVRNSDDSLCKVYNEMFVNVTGANPKIIIHAGLTGVTSDFDVLGTGLYNNKRSKLVFKTNGDIEVALEGASGTVYVALIACLIFVKNFGDA